MGMTELRITMTADKLIAMNHKGQTLTEFLFVLTLIVFPLTTGGLLWFRMEFNKSKVAFQIYSEARQKMIQTQTQQVISFRQGEAEDTITLLPLEDLDLQKSGLSPRDLGQQAIQLWEGASHFLQQLQDLASSK